MSGFFLDFHYHYFKKSNNNVTVNTIYRTIITTLRERMYKRNIYVSIIILQLPRHDAFNGNRV